MTQKEALNVLKLGYNVFLTGFAGSGKTYLLHQYINYLKQKGVKVGVTASTGIAAANLGGLTLNSWSGIGISKSLTSDDLKQIHKRNYLRQRIEQSKVLIIDEVSMLPSVTLEMVDKVCRYFTNKDQPFGGVQVVLCGDFFQLPPVCEDGQKFNFIYRSKLWSELNLKVCYLTSNFRQEDERFLKILNEIRNNEITKESIKLLASRLIKNNNEKMSTRLYTHNVNVDSINDKELKKLKGVRKVFNLNAAGDLTIISSVKRNSYIPEKLSLKKEALVMFIKNNFQKGYVNGSIGKVINFNYSGYPEVMLSSGQIVSVPPAEWRIEEGGKVLASFKQIPLRLAWAITVHKSQGMSLENAEIDLGRPFAPGMGYVALSRVKSLKGITLKSLNHKALLINKEVLAIDKKFQTLSKTTRKELKQIPWLEKQLKQQEFILSLKKSKSLPHNINLLRFPKFNPYTSSE